MICLSADNKKWLALAMVFNAVVSRLAVSASHAKKLIAITQYSLLITHLLLLSACGSSSSEEVTQQPEKPKEKPVLKIYLYAPETPIITRASTGSVSASEAENAIHTIDVWVFEHEAPYNKVSYIHLNDVSFTGQKEIAMDITDAFANLPKKPNVDIYVAVNKESCGLGTTLGENTTLAQLKEAYMGSDYFGVSPLISTVPDEEGKKGLPMSGLLENQIISGIPPVYTAMAQNVKLVRAVSKVRFVFSKSSGGVPTISNLSIKLNENVLPQEEYLFLEGVYPTYKSHVKSTGDNDYEPQVTLVSDKGSNDINACDNPAGYVYTSETGQAYETKIDNGLTIVPVGKDTPDLSELGRFYFRESHRQLAGSISYTIGENNKTKTFTMAGAGDFTRNHTWIVYGYFLGSGDLKLNVVDVKDWTSGSENPDLYNW